MSEDKKNRSDIMKNEKVGKLLVLYSMPVFFSYLFNSVDNIVCRAFIGNSVGSEGIAAISVAFPITTTVLSFAFLLGMGGSTLAAACVGAGDKKAANRAMNMSLHLLVCVGLVITVTGNLFLKELLVLFGASDAVLPYAMEYARIMLCGCMFQLISVGLTNYMRVEGRTGLAMIAVIVGPILNLTLCIVLIKILNWGLTGAALATTTGQFGCTVVVVVHYLRSKDFFHFDKTAFKPDFKLSARIAYLGLSSFTLQICQSLVSILLNRMARKYGGDIAVSGMGVVTTIQTFILTISTATNMGSQSLIAYNYGAKLYDRVREFIRKAIFATVTVVLVEFVVLCLFNRPIAAVFCKNNAEVIDFSSRALVIYLCASTLVPIQIQGAGFFQAIKKPIYAMFLSLTRQGIILAPLLFTLPRFFGIDGMLYAGPVADFISVCITLPILLKYLKKIRESGIISERV